MLVNPYDVAHKITHEKEAITTIEVEEMAKELIRLERDFEEVDQEIAKVLDTVLAELIKFQSRKRKALHLEKTPKDFSYWQGRATMAAEIFHTLRKEKN